MEDPDTLSPGHSTCDVVRINHGIVFTDVEMGQIQANTAKKTQRCYAFIPIASSNFAKYTRCKFKKNETLGKGHYCTEHSKLCEKFRHLYKHEKCPASETAATAAFGEDLANDRIRLIARRDVLSECYEYRICFTFLYKNAEVWKEDGHDGHIHYVNRLYAKIAQINDRLAILPRPQKEVTPPIDPNANKSFIDEGLGVKTSVTVNPSFFKDKSSDTTQVEKKEKKKKNKGGKSKITLKQRNVDTLTMEEFNKAINEMPKDEKQRPSWSDLIPTATDMVQLTLYSHQVIVDNIATPLLAIADSFDLFRVKEDFFTINNVQLGEKTDFMRNEYLVSMFRDGSGGKCTLSSFAELCKKSEIALNITRMIRAIDYIRHGIVPLYINTKYKIPPNKKMEPLKKGFDEDDWLIQSHQLMLLFTRAMGENESEDSTDQLQIKINLFCTKFFRMPFMQLIIAEIKMLINFMRYFGALAVICDMSSKYFSEFAWGIKPIYERIKVALDEGSGDEENPNSKTKLISISKKLIPPLEKLLYTWTIGFKHASYGAEKEYAENVHDPTGRSTDPKFWGVKQIELQRLGESKHGKEEKEFKAAVSSDNVAQPKVTSLITTLNGVMKRLNNRMLNFDTGENFMNRYATFFRVIVCAFDWIADGPTIELDVLGRIDGDYLDADSLELFNECMESLAITLKTRDKSGLDDY
jgi:hypothetical protein